MAGLAQAGTILSQRALNRATLTRQLLLGRERRSALDTVSHLVGLQAQEPRDPYVALWSRLEGFGAAELEQLLLERRVARSPLMRATLHLATAEDCLALRPLLEPVMLRLQKGAFGRRLAGADPQQLARVGREFFTRGPATFAEFRRSLGEEWSAFPRDVLGYTVSYLVPLVQVPPRGLLSDSGQATWTTSEAWLGRPLRTDFPLERLVLRYLAAFGPASVMDMQAWSGLTRLRSVFEGLRSRLVAFRDEGGREVFDLPEAPRPPEDAPAPVRFLPEYDNLLLGHKDRRRFVSAALLRQMIERTEIGLGNVLIDGMVAGDWKLLRRDGQALLRLSSASSWPAGQLDEVLAEGRRLLRLLAPKERLEVQLDA